MRRLRSHFIPVLLFVALAGVQRSEGSSWSFVQIPGFIHHDSRYPGTAWEDAYAVVLNAIKAENPDVVLFTGIGDFIFGRWPLKESIEYYADKYYPEWIRRLTRHGLDYYVTVGAFELGGFPWNGEKRLQFPLYQGAFARYLDLPKNGPADLAGLAFAKRHHNVLILSLNLMESVNEQGRPEISETQLDWFQKMVDQNRDVDHVIVTGYFSLSACPSATNLTSLPGHSYPKLLQTLSANRIALYLHGDTEAISIQNENNLCQVSPGGMFGWTPTVNYTVVTIKHDKLHIEVKSKQVTCSHFSKGPDLLFPKTIAFDKEQIVTGFRSVGSVDLVQQDSSYKLKNRAGCFQDNTR